MYSRYIFLITLRYFQAYFHMPDQRSLILLRPDTRWSRVTPAAPYFMHLVSLCPLHGCDLCIIQNCPKTQWHRGKSAFSHAKCTHLAHTRLISPLHPFIPSFHPSIPLFMSNLFWLTWQQTMSRLLFWWHHYRRQANPQKTYHLLSSLSLSLPLSLSQTYWSRIQITDAKRRWAGVKGRERRWKRKGEEKRRGKQRERERERERERKRNSHSYIWTAATPTTSHQSDEMECMFALISILGDFGINHRHTHMQNWFSARIKAMQTFGILRLSSLCVTQNIGIINAQQLFMCIENGKRKGMSCSLTHTHTHTHYRILKSS